MDKLKGRKKDQEVIELSSNHETFVGWQDVENEIKPMDSLFDDTNKNSTSG